MPYLRRRAPLQLGAALTLAAALLMLAPPSALALPGDLDTTFTPVIVNDLDSLNIVDAVAVQPDGKILVGGMFSGVSGHFRRSLARLNADGSVDDTFVPPAFRGARFKAIHVNADGTILAAGLYYKDNTVASLRQIGLFSSTGALLNDLDLSSFNNHDDDSNVASSMLVEPDGNIVLGGYFYYIKDVLTPGLVRISPSGQVVTALGGPLAANLRNDPVGPVDVRAILRQPDGKLIVGGEFLTGDNRAGLVRLNTDGTIDSSFVNTGTDSGAVVTGAAFEPDGRILIVGSFTTIDGQFAPHLTRLAPTGANDFNHAALNTFSMGAPLTMYRYADGRFLLGGALGQMNNVTRYGVARLNADFTIDGFYPQPNGVQGEVHAIDVQGDGNVVIGGFWNVVAGVNQPKLARLLDTPNTAPQLTGVAVTSAITENGTVTLTGTVTESDAGDQATLTVNWGDGSLADSSNYSSGSSPFSLMHQYLDDSPSGTSSDNYTITLSVADGYGGSASGSASTTVANAAPSLNNVAISPSSITAGGSATLSANIADVGTLDPHTVVISWGDGSSNTTLNLPASTTSFSQGHQYNAAGSFAISVSVTDDDSGRRPGERASR